MTYTLIQQFSDQHINITFPGQFEGKRVTWDTHFFTLHGYNKKKKNIPTEQRQFIDIQQTNSNVMKLTVALKVNEVSKPNIHKMMIMIKQYKNLTLGRHEYG